MNLHQVLHYFVLLQLPHHLRSVVSESHRHEELELYCLEVKFEQERFDLHSQLLVLYDLKSLACPHLLHPRRQAGQDQPDVIEVEEEVLQTQFQEALPSEDL